MIEGRRVDGAEMVILEDSAALASEAAIRTCASAQEAIDARGVAHVALTGGSSAAGLYREIRSPARRTWVDWQRLHLWWGDERYVPFDHPESNAGLAMKLLYDPGLVEEVDRSEALPLPATNVHPVPVDEAIGHGLGASWAAERYGRMLTEGVASPSSGDPTFDLVLLGVGADGHILSVFPGRPAPASDAPLVMAVPAPTHIGPHVERVTLHPRVIEAARRVLVMVPGAAKAGIVRDVLTGGPEHRALPARLALRAEATWLLDRESAAELDTPPPT